MSWCSGDSDPMDEEWDVLSASSIDDSRDESTGDSESTTHSFVVLSTPLLASSRSVSVPSNLNCDFESASLSNLTTSTRPADGSISSVNEQDFDSGRTTPGDASNASITSIQQNHSQDESGRPTPDDVSEISFTSSSECDNCEEPVKRRSLMQHETCVKTTQPLPQIINAALKTTPPVPLRYVFLSCVDPTVITRGDSQTRVSYLHWYAFFCDFWPVVMNRFGSDFSRMPLCLLEQYRRFFELPAGSQQGAHITLYQLLTPRLPELLAVDPYNKYLYDLLCYAYRAAYARYLFD